MMEPTPGEPSKKLKSDLAVRTLSAVVMVAVAGGALWIGGWIWAAFVIVAAAGVFWEWMGLVRRITTRRSALVSWTIGGVLFIGLAIFTLIKLRMDDFHVALMPILLVIGVDVGAYFTGRTLGGPKIAPAISPSKTWSGLIGGCLGAAAMLFVIITQTMGRSMHEWAFSVQALCVCLIVGSLVAIVAQSGDFFESWMKRRAGVKDSGNLIPGHGGLFDRTDGLIAVLFVIGLMFFSSWVLD